jgi:hypothetical protein
MTTYSNADLDDMFDGGKAATVNVLNDIAAATEPRQQGCPERAQLWPRHRSCHALCCPSTSH